MTDIRKPDMWMVMQNTGEVLRRRLLLESLFISDGTIDSLLGVVSRISEGRASVDKRKACREMAQLEDSGMVRLVDDGITYSLTDYGRDMLVRADEKERETKWLIAAISIQHGPSIMDELDSYWPAVVIAGAVMVGTLAWVAWVAWVAW